MSLLYPRNSVSTKLSDKRVLCGLSMRSLCEKPLYGAEVAGVHRTERKSQPSLLKRCMIVTDAITHFLCGCWGS